MHFTGTSGLTITVTIDNQTNKRKGRGRGRGGGGGRVLETYWVVEQNFNVSMVYNIYLTSDSCLAIEYRNIVIDIP